MSAAKARPGSERARETDKPRVDPGDELDVVRWIWRGSALLVLLIGWVFILWHNNFHVTPSVVFAGLGYFAGVAAIYTMFRTGASAVAEERELITDASWGRPLGARGELEREKRVLLKAIKEAEFDHEMGKLSKADADEMIATYRGRAIAVIKELESRDGRVGSVREQIEREVRARLELDGKGKGKGGDKGKGKPDKKAEAKANNAKAKVDEPKAKAKEAKAAAAKAEDADADADETDTEADATADEAKAKADSAKADEAKADADDEAKADAKADDAKTDEPAAQEATP